MRKAYSARFAPAKRNWEKIWGVDETQNRLLETGLPVSLFSVGGPRCEAGQWPPVDGPARLAQW